MKFWAVLNSRVDKIWSEKKEKELKQGSYIKEKNEEKDTEKKLNLHIYHFWTA